MGTVTGPGVSWWDTFDTILDPSSSLSYPGTGKNKALPSISQAFIGRFQIASPAYANSRVSNIQIYNKALSLAEIKTNYNGLKKRYGL
jgi:hypothetical protein